MTGNLTAPVFIGNLTGNANSATKLSTARTLTIGSKGEAFDGTANLTWTHTEMEVMPRKIMSTSAKDWDTIETGMHIIKVTDSVNAPATNHGLLICDLDVGTDFQIFFPDTTPIIYKRSFDNTNKVWKPWSTHWNISVDSATKATQDANGKVIASSYLPLTGGTLTGNLQVNGYLRVGNNVNGDNNYIAFYGTTSDMPEYTHCYIGENLYSGTESSELVLFKGNDPETAAGPDRIRYIGARHVFQIYKTAVSGSFTSVCDSTVPITQLEITASGATFAGALTVSGALTLGGAVQFANNTLNKSGDDCYFGDQNVGGAFCIKGSNGATQLRFIQYNGTAAAAITWDGTKLTSSAPFYGAVWNDYAEFREADSVEPGYVMIEDGDDKLTKSTERLQSFAGVSSDTFGFAIGETDRAKTPIATSGRVLVYPYQKRENYKSGDCVCSAPDGKVDIMDRDEIQKYPDKIVGIVSHVPSYKKWGGGSKASLQTSTSEFGLECVKNRRRCA